MGTLKALFLIVLQKLCKRMRTFILGFVFLFFYSCNTTETDYDFTTTFEKSNGLKTATYAEVIDFYKNLAL